MSKVIPFTGERLPGAQLIPEADVTVERLRTVLETAVIDVEIDEEGDLYLTDGVDYPIWVRVAIDRKTVELFTFIRKVVADAPAVAVRLNALNLKFALGQFHQLEDAIYSRHGVSFDGGLLPRQFVKTVRRFSGSFREAIGEMSDLMAVE